MQKWKWRKSLNVLINYADASLFKEISEALTGKEKQTLQLQFAPAPYQPDPFKVTDPSAEAYRQILSAIIPAQQEKRQRGSILQLLPFGKAREGSMNRYRRIAQQVIIKEEPAKQEASAAAAQVAAAGSAAAAPKKKLFGRGKKADVPEIDFMDQLDGELAGLPDIQPERRKKSRSGNR
ncbi:hypothetical protein [Paenibacillus validus]|uniref:hypothetical protein n=1 Tax=Paenibacillus validus TaxID=44253 RepID=UPI003D2C7C7C